MDYYNYAYTTGPSVSPVYGIVSLAVCVLLLVALWRVFTKAGQPGWAVIIPIYDAWVLYKIICGRGTAMLRMLIPIYNIYWGIKSCVKLAHAYGKSTGFGVGLLFFSPIFLCILAFGDARYVGPQQM